MPIFYFFGFFFSSFKRSREKTRDRTSSVYIFWISKNTWGISLAFLTEDHDVFSNIKFLIRGEQERLLRRFRPAPIEIGWKKFSMAVRALYYRIRLENSDFLLIDQLNIQKRTSPPTPATSPDFDWNRSEFGWKKFSMAVGSFYPQIRLENFDLWSIDWLNILILDQWSMCKCHHNIIINYKIC